jgi:hypothetical protein
MMFTREKAGRARNGPGSEPDVSATMRIEAYGPAAAATGEEPRHSVIAGVTAVYRGKYCLARG